MTRVGPNAAGERYELEVQLAARWKVPFLTLAAIIWGLLTQQPWTYGGRRAVIVDRIAGNVVGVIREPPIVNERSRFALLLEAHETLSPTEFKLMWLPQGAIKGW